MRLQENLSLQGPLGPGWSATCRPQTAIGLGSGPSLRQPVDALKRGNWPGLGASGGGGVALLSRFPPYVFDAEGKPVKVRRSRTPSVAAVRNFRTSRNAGRFHTQTSSMRVREIGSLPTPAPPASATFRRNRRSTERRHLYDSRTKKRESRWM